MQPVNVLIRAAIERSFRLARDRSGATAVIVAVTLPAMLIGMAAAVETSLLGIRKAQIQGVADAAAAAAREDLNPFQFTAANGSQQTPINTAVSYANKNLPDSVVAADVQQGWWDITKPSTADRWGPPVEGQVAGHFFSNAVRVTAQVDHHLLFASLLGVSSRHLSDTATAYKCSNLDYPLTRIEDDRPTPALPAIYMSWPTPDHPDPTSSYYYTQPNGAKNPIFKFYSPYDGQDVSFVLTLSNGYKLQVDTYCAGTYLVSPAEFNIDDPSWGNKVTAEVITGSVERGSTNNSFAVYTDQTLYPFAGPPTSYYTKNSYQTPQYDLTKVRTTTYPSSNGNHDWASEGDPTPDRRSLLVRVTLPVE